MKNLLAAMKSRGLRTLAAHMALPAALLGAVFALAALWGAQHYLLQAARRTDIETATRELASYAACYGHPGHASAATLPSGTKLLPPGASHPKPGVRVLSPGSDLEACAVLRAPDGTELGYLVISRPAETTLMMLTALRAFTLTALAASIVIVAATVFAAALALTRFAQRIGARLSAFAPQSGAGDDETPEAVELRLETTLALATAERDAREFLISRHTESACVSTRECILLDANPAYCRMFQSTREELVGKSFLDLIPPMERKDIIENIQRLTPRNPSGTVRHRVILPDGSERWMRWTDTAVFDPDGRIDRLFSVGIDITPEREAMEREAALRDAFDQMQSLAQTGSITMDLRSGSMEVTQEARRILGVGNDSSPESFFAAIDTADRAKVEALFAHARSEAAAFETEFRVPSAAEGKVRTLLCRAEMRADPKTKLLSRLTCTLLDISTLRAAESELRSELAYRQAVESSVAVGIVVRDMKGRTLSANERFCRMVGWTEEELCTSETEPYWPSDGNEDIKAALGEAIKGNTPPGGFELVFCRRDGSRFDALVNVAPLIDAGGNQTGILGAVTDISALQHARRELRTAEAELRRQLAYRLAVNRSVGVGIVVRDTDGRIASINEQFTTMFGWSEAELVGRSLADTPYWPPQDGEALAARVRHALAHPAHSDSLERQFTRKDGTKIDILLTATALLNSENHLIGSLAVFTDITAQQQMRRDLRAAELEARLELRYRTAIEDATSAGILVIDRRGSLIHANRVFSDMVGYSEDEILQMSYPPAFCVKEDFAAIEDVRVRMLSGQSPRRTFNMQLRRRDGTLFDAMVRTRKMPGSSEGWVVTVTDVTQLLRTREKLREAEASAKRETRLREAIERAAGVGITAMDKDGIPLYANDAFCAMIGYTREEWLHMRPPYAFWPPEEYGNIERALGLCLEGKTPEQGFQLIFARKDGSRIDVLIRDTRLYDEQNHLVGFISSITDISVLQKERRRAEAAEQRAKEELAYREAIEQSADVGIMVHSPDGKVLSVNAAMQRMSGYTEQEVLGMTPPYPTWPPDQREAIHAAFRSYLEGRAPLDGYQLRFRRKDGSDFDALIRCTSILGAKGAPKALVSVITDVSSLQEAQRALQGANDRLSLAKQVAKLGTFTWDEAEATVLMDDEALALFGHAPGADSNMVWRTSMDEPARRALEASTAKAVSEGNLEGTATYWIRRPDGERREVSSSYRVLRADRPGHVKLFGVIRDVTTERNTLHQFETYNTRFKIAQDVAEFGIWDWDPASDQLYWDGQSFAIFGHPQATDAQAVWTMVIDEEKRVQLTEKLLHLIATGAKDGQDRLHVIWPDRSHHEILSTFEILRDAEGRPTRVIGINRDVTGEIEAERDLSDAQERLAAALDGARFGTFEHVFGVGDMNWNDANYEINGIAPSITDPAELFEAWKAGAGKAAGQVEEMLRTLPADQNTLAYEFTAKPAKGSPRRVRVSAFIQRDNKGRARRLVGVTWLAEARGG